MQISKKLLTERVKAVADAISSADIEQVAREQIASDVADALDGLGLRHDVFKLVASDPLVLCAGAKGHPCPWQRRIRIAMHLSTAPDGRAASWEPRAPVGIRCVTCGAAEYVEGYAENSAQWQEATS